MVGRHAATAALGFGLIVVLGVPAIASAQDHRPRGINAREHRQVERIKHGVKDEEITPAELTRLRAEEGRLRAEEARYRESADGLNKREYKDLEKDLNKISKRIKRATDKQSS